MTTNEPFRSLRDTEYLSVPLVDPVKVGNATATVYRDHFDRYRFVVNGDPGSGAVVSFVVDRVTLDAIRQIGSYLATALGSEQGQ